MSKYGVFSGPYFPVFSPNTGKYGPEKNHAVAFFEKTVKDFWKKMFIVDFAVIHKIFETIFSFCVK